jgi:hypothetical protein
MTELCVEKIKLEPVSERSDCLKVITTVTISKESIQLLLLTINPCIKLVL